MKNRERAAGWLMGALSWATLGITFIFLGLFVQLSLPFFYQLDWGAFFTSTQWTPLYEVKAFGILPLLTGTLMCCLIALFVALPVGLSTAVFLQEFASSWIKELALGALHVLSVTPSVVYGFLALHWLTPLLQRLIPHLQTYNALVPGVLMGIMILPIITSITREAMQAMPSSLRNEAEAMGASRWQIVHMLLLPYSRRGIAAAALLALSRALGETMIVSIAAGQHAGLTLNPLEATQTASSYILQLSLGDVGHDSTEYSSLFAVALSLFVFTYLLNWIGYRLGRSLTHLSYLAKEHAPI
ncbi:MAG: phosphate ABC transporter permease subunit PstC [Bacteroidetes bacterium]|nr:phosphate ABC transporter permease subunit PstC [Bacteroidota bacterium]